MRLGSSRVRMRPKEIYPPNGDLCPVKGFLEPQALLACLLLESTPTGRLFCLAAVLSQTSQRRVPPTNLDHWKRNCSLKGPLEPQAPSARSLLESTQ